MNLNPAKKVKIANSSASESSKTADGLKNLEKKTIAKLNHDCLAKIFMYTSILDRLEMENVCQKWREAIEISWYNIKKLNLNALMITLDKKKEILKKIMWRCCRYLTHLTISDEQYSWLADILEDNCQKMIYFNMEVQEAYRIPNYKLVEIIESMSKLKYLKVSADDSADWDNIVLYKILKVLPEDIEEIHFFETVGWRLFPQVLLDEFHNLHCLTFQAMDITYETRMPSQNTLTHLDLSRSQFSSHQSQVFSNLKNLEQLILLNVVSFNVNAITSMARNCSKLKHLQFTRMDDQHKNFPYHIFRELRYLNLEYLECDKVVGKKHKIFALGNNWKNLKYLDVGGGEGFSLLDFQEITKFKNLEHLIIYYATKFDSKSLINITTSCLALKEIFMDFGNISKTAIETFTNLKQLEKFIFTHEYKLTGHLLSKIVNNCHNLVDLNLSSCKNLTEASLIEVGKFKYLKNLDISDIKNVPKEMFYNLHKLYSLTCNRCPSVTDEDIMRVIDNCKILTYLYVQKTGITVRSLVHALNREFVFTKLNVYVDKHVQDAYNRNNTPSMFEFPSLKIHNMITHYD